MISKAPGSTTRCISIVPQAEASCGVSVKVRVFGFARPARLTRWKPFSSLTGRVTEPTN